LEELLSMETEPGRRPNLTGWNLAAALGLLAAAFLVERLAPQENQGFSERKTKRETSALGLTAEGNDRGRLAASPSEIPAKGWKDILLRVYTDYPSLAQDRGEEPKACVDQSWR
jgi:membrane protein